VLGYPVLCTDILPYQGDLPVFRVPNRLRDWVRAIRDLVADRKALERDGERLRQAVLAEWMLEDHLDLWRQAWLP
jgi:O-antigen biosynthesis protein